ncbi:MAG: cell division ATP-binding protein FtsE [bacterium]|nr:cell division ATP-binding protein FtsE [bacterium]
MIVFDEVSKQYNLTNALSDINLEIEDGEFVFLIGPSGAGKSTLLKLLIREELPTQGQIFVGESEITSLPSNRVPHLRRVVGTIFQDFKLLPQRTVFENVAFPLEIIGLADEEVSRTSHEALKLVNLASKAEHFPWQLSGGEQQRTAIARSMVQRPEVLLADEPTGNLDPQSAWEVMQLLAKLNKLGTTIVMATHNLDITSSLPHRMLEIREGKIARDTKPKKESKETKEEKK